MTMETEAGTTIHRQCWGWVVSSYLEANSNYFYLSRAVGMWRRANLAPVWLMHSLYWLTLYTIKQQYFISALP